MAGLPWVKLDVNLPDDPRVAALALHLRVERPTALGLVTALFTWTARFYPSGTLPGGDDKVGSIEDGCRWTGDRGAFIAALRATGFLSRDRGRLVVAKWRDEQAAHAEKLEHDRERMRLKRANAAKAKEDARATRRATVARPSRVEERRVEERREEETRPDSPPTPHDSSRDPDPRLAGFRKKLANQLGMERIDLGRDPDDVVAFFEEQIAANGEECMLLDCLEIASRSNNGTPTSLAFFPGWFRRLPPQPHSR